jgi:hypothetical protein
MKIFSDDSDLVKTLDCHDSLLKSCASGNLSFSDFLEKYNDFSMYYALDGHESDEEEKIILAKHASRIAVHFRVWDEILTGLCSDEHATDPQYIKCGRFGSHEGILRLQKIVREEFS